ncbi:piggyBac transposable element-derived protein 3-like [Aphis craccivora]|uniref:PiggyBac transposable element-derived protein 3-like n=1 Tax=Aphis craccivora TaxID=307492 RepID=A0A6G0YG94_APHCR|nr:piggyBac transposable element-derived protein 3-like [Aphis craccivora]
MCVTSWKDNKQVNLLSTYFGSLPMLLASTFLFGTAATSVTDTTTTTTTAVTIITAITTRTLLTTAIVEFFYM